MHLPTPAARFVLLALGATAPQISHAQEAPSGPPEPSRFRDPQDGQFDVSSFLEKPQGLLPVPVIITEPAVGYGGGMVGMFLRPREKAGEQGWASPNISAIGAIGTENGTRAAFAGDASRWLDGRFKTLAGVGGGHINLDFYGLGGDRASLDEAIRYSLDFDLLFLQGTWRVTPQSHWSIGLRYIYSQVEPKLRDEPVFPGLAERVDVDISAPAAVLEFDTRDNVFTPTRGIFAETVFLASRESLGANVDFDRFQQVVMGWYPITDAVTFGMRADYQKASDDAPFFLRPYIDLRGVQAMRYQGDEMASAEIEARWQFRSRWSAVGAAGAGTAHSTRPNFSATQDVASGAVGLRYELARKFGLHAGLDVGFSSETTAIYFQVGNAWFRP